MKTGEFFDHELRPRQVLVFFLIANLLYVLPLILSDLSYMDDNWRALAAENALFERGRLFADWLYQALTFTGAAPNIFPLPLLVSIVAMSLALARLTVHYFSEPTLVSCLVPLPLCYNPFLLQNLSYQYDGPTMLLSLVAVIYAITFDASSRVQRWLVPSVLIALATGLYQISLNVFLGLCCMELLRAIHRPAAWADILRILGWKVIQLTSGLLIYAVTAYPLMDSDHEELINLSLSAFPEIGSTLVKVLEKVALLFQGGYLWLFIALVLCAAIGGMRLGREIFEQQPSRSRFGVMSLVGLLTLPALILLIPGITLLIREYDVGARTLMGFGVLLVWLFYLAHLALAPCHRRLPLLLVIPLMAMLSLSFAYGRVLTMRKTFDSAALYSLTYDIAAHPELRKAKLIYLSVPSFSSRWLVSAGGSFKQLPVLKYLLNVDYFMLPESLSWTGITNVVFEDERGNATRMADLGYAPLVDSLYYRIYVVGDYAFIVTHEPPENASRHW
ncbi:glucosyltransferase domain-containing protein [Pseudomonas sp. Eth.TT006]